MMETTGPSEETTKLVPNLPSEITTTHNMELPEEEGSYYILIPLGVFLVIIILSLLVYLMARNRRRLAHVYCKNRRQGKRYDDDDDSPLEHGTLEQEEEDEVDNDNEDNPTKSLLRGKLQINNRYENYLSTSHLNKSSELFT